MLHETGFRPVLKEVLIRLPAYSVPAEIDVPTAPMGIPQLNPSPCPEAQSITKHPMT